MATADPMNANPTILNPSDLPTRRASATASGPATTSIFARPSSSTVPLLDPFADDLPSPSTSTSSDDDEIPDPIDEQEVFDLISTISDPEHPLSLGSLSVVSLPDIHILPPTNPDSPSPISTVTVLITPTITHCSLATVIGLGVRVRLEQALPPRFRVDVRIKEGSHTTAREVTKQLNDKERVAAALENATLRGVLGGMLATCK